MPVLAGSDRENLEKLIMISQCDSRDGDRTPATEFNSATGQTGLARFAAQEKY